MKNKELLQRVQSLYSKGVQSDDTRLSSRHIYNACLTVRSKLLYQQLSKKQKLSEFNYSILECVELIEVPVANCPCVPFNCKVLRTRYPLPKPMTNFNTHVIEFVMSGDYKVRFSEVSRIEYEFSKHNKYTSNSPRYILENEYLFVYGNNLPKMINIKLLLENPDEKYSFPNLCSSLGTLVDNCIAIEDLDFLIDAHLEEDLIQIVSKELIDKFIQIPQDKTNDFEDNRAIK